MQSQCNGDPSRPVYLIAAVAANGVIGRQGQLPWEIPEDARFFLDKSREGVLIMGRKSFEGFQEEARERAVIVVTRTKTDLPDAQVVASFSEGLELAGTHPEPGPVWICGGTSIYQEALSVGDRLYLTHVLADVEGDTFFPAQWADFFPRKVDSRLSHSGGFDLEFAVYEPVIKNN